MPKTTVSAVIIESNKILLERRAIEPFRGKWCLPGGHIENGETALEALKREVKEETGLNVKKYKFLFYVDEIFPDINWYAISLVFKCETEGKIKIQKSEVEDIKWFKISEAKKLPLAFKLKEILDKIKV